MPAAAALTLRAAVSQCDVLAVAPAFQAVLMMTLRIEFRLDAYTYTRVISPLPVLLLAGDLGINRRRPLLSLGLMLPRVGLQLGRQVLGILRRSAG